MIISFLVQTKWSFLIVFFVLLPNTSLRVVFRRQEPRGCEGDRRGLQRSETSRSVGSLGGRASSTGLGGRVGTTSLGGKTVVSGRNLRSSLSKSVESIEQVGLVLILFDQTDPLFSFIGINLIDFQDQTK